MKKSQRLNIIAELNANNEKKSLEALGDVQKKKLDVKKQLENLEQYRQDYKDQYQSMSETGVNIKQLLEFRAFISKVDKAIEEQEHVVLGVDNQVESMRKDWEILHHKTKSMHKVCETAVLAEVKAEEKREQNEQDDRASRVGRKGVT